MEEQTVVAESSSAVESPSFEVPKSGPEYAEWRITGKLPEKKVTPQAESAPAPEEEPTDDAGAEPARQQEKTRRKPDAEARIKSLTDELKQLRARLDESSKPKPTQAESSPARQEKSQTGATRPKPTVDAKNPDGTPKYSTYEDYVEDLADYKAEQRWAAVQREQAAQKQVSELRSKVDDARARYGDQIDAVLAPTVSRIMNDASITPTIKAMLNDSEVLPDLIYTLGSESAQFEKFLQMAPGKQIRYLAALESGIQAELSGPTRNQAGQFSKAEKAESPAKRGPESAPEPPLEIGARGRGGDETSRLLQAIERGEPNAFHAWKQAEDRKALARRKGV